MNGNVLEAPANNSEETWQMTLEKLDDEKETIASRGMSMKRHQRRSFSSIKLHNDLFPSL
jgi:hypothetical protein